MPSMSPSWCFLPGHHAYCAPSLRRERQGQHAAPGDDPRGFSSFWGWWLEGAQRWRRDGHGMSFSRRRPTRADPRVTCPTTAGATIDGARPANSGQRDKSGPRELRSVVRKCGASALAQRALAGMRACATALLYRRTAHVVTCASWLTGSSGVVSAAASAEDVTSETRPAGVGLRLLPKPESILPRRLSWDLGTTEESKRRATTPGNDEWRGLLPKGGIQRGWSDGTSCPKLAQSCCTMLVDQAGMASKASRKSRRSTRGRCRKSPRSDRGACPRSAP